MKNENSNKHKANTARFENAMTGIKLSHNVVIDFLREKHENSTAILKEQHETLIRKMADDHEEHL